MNRTLCVITGTRAEYGLMRRMMLAIRDTPGLTLQVIATGSHLAPQFGLTYREIEKDGIAITAKVELPLEDDSAEGIAAAIASGVSGFARAYAELAPDMVIVLGDRYEILAAATAAMVSRIPIAHIHGGESTEGAMDEAIRHAITKMAHVHFVAAPAYRDRVIQLGEQPANVHLVGGLGVDAIAHVERLDKAALEHATGFTFGATNLLVTFHPVTLERATATDQMQQLLVALDRLPDAHILFTMPNADPGSRALFTLIEDFVRTHPRSCVHASLGQRNYLSALALVDAVVGNSSSGLIEAPSLHVATVNIGDRQLGRLKAQSVIDCAPEAEAILAAITTACAAPFKQVVATATNPYGHAGASEKIVAVLADLPLEGLLKKRFHDIATTP